jgi:hypothetical protein
MGCISAQKLNNRQPLVQISIGFISELERNSECYREKCCNLQQRQCEDVSAGEVRRASIPGKYRRVVQLTHALSIIKSHSASY